MQGASLIAQLVKNPPVMQEILGKGRSAGEGIGYPFQYSWASLVTQLVKNLPAMWETWVWFLDWEDHLEKGKATRSSILAWRSPWGCKESETTERLSLSFYQNNQNQFSFLLTHQENGKKFSLMICFKRWKDKYKDKYKERQIRIWYLYMWNLRYHTNCPICETKTDSDIENRLLVAKGEEGSREG